MAEAATFFHLGLDFQERGLFDLAIQEYNKALELDPDNLDVLVNLGAAYLQKGLPERSTQALSMALSLKSDHPLALFNLGKAYLYRDETDRALDVFRKAEKVMPEDFDVKKSIAHCLNLLGQKEEAVDILFPLREILSSDGPATLLLGRTLMELQRFPDAMEVFRKAVNAFPDSVPALDGLIRCQIELGLKDKALTSLKRGLMSNPQDPGFNLMMVDLHLEAGEIDEAVALMKKALLANPGHVDLRRKMDEIARRMPILKKKANHSGLIEKSSRYETEVYDILDSLYESRITLNVAINTMRELRTRDQADLFIANELANLYFQGKRYQEAMDLYGEIQKAAPQETRHRINFAKCLALSGNIPLAVEYLEDSQREFPRDTELPLALVEMRLLEHDYFGANRVLEKAMLSNPDNVRGLFLQSYINLRLGNLDFSAESFKRLLRLAADDEEVVLWYSRLMILKGTPQLGLDAWGQFNDGVESLLEILTKIELCLAIGDMNAARDLLNRVGNYEPRFIEDHLMFGKAYFYARDYKTALDKMEIVLKQDHDNPEALALSAMAHLHKNKGAKFWMLWQKAIESDSFYAVLTAMIQLKTLNFSHIDKLRNETRKILDISVRNDLDRARLSLLLKYLQP